VVRVGLIPHAELPFAADIALIPAGGIAKMSTFIVGLYIFVVSMSEAGQVE
jgi:hypothetical protein